MRASRGIGASRGIVRCNEHRNHGPAFDTWPASLPQITYIVEDGGNLCVTCTNEHAEDNVKSREQDPQWRVVAAQVNKGQTQCDHCYRMIQGDL